MDLQSLMEIAKVCCIFILFISTTFAVSAAIDMAYAKIRDLEAE